MCKLMEDMRNEYGKEIAKEVAIESAIETARQFGISEDAILGNIMGRFNLTEAEAKNYMLKKSA